MAQEATQEVGNPDLWPCTYAECRGICRDENGSHFNESGNFALRCHREGAVKITAHYTKVTPEPALHARPCNYGVALKFAQRGWSWRLPFSPTPQNIFFFFFLQWKLQVMMIKTIITGIVTSVYTAAVKNALCGWCCMAYITESCQGITHHRRFFTQARINNCQVLLKKKERDDMGTNDMVQCVPLRLWEKKVICWEIKNKKKSA